ncbi:MAG: sugar phosphate isomerase/epimerase [Cytophagales bacterium]|nr:sugar phosphate isomerase/epimerase [Armatimonadota bacterium]
MLETTATNPQNAAGSLVLDAPSLEESLLEERVSPETMLLSLPDVLEHSDAEPFRYCLNTSTLRGHHLSLSELVDVAAAAGYEAIEPWIDEIEKFAAEGGDLRDLAARIRDLGLTVESGIGFFEWIVDDPARRLSGIQGARHSMGLLARIGGKRIAAPPWGIHEAGSPSLNLMAAAERYRDLLELGDEMGVIPQVEFWGFSANLSRLSEAALLTVDSGHSDACILADVYHLRKGGSPVNGIGALGPEVFKVFHVNDFPDLPAESLTDADRVYPGDGVAPLRPLLRDLRDIGFTGYLSLELFNPEYYQQDPLSVARTGLEKLRGVVKDAFEL